MFFPNLSVDVGRAANVVQKSFPFLYNGNLFNSKGFSRDSYFVCVKSQSEYCTDIQWYQYNLRPFLKDHVKDNTGGNSTKFTKTKFPRPANEKWPISFLWEIENTSLFSLFVAEDLFVSMPSGVMVAKMQPLCVYSMPQKFLKRQYLWFVKLSLYTTSAIGGEINHLNGFQGGFRGFPESADNFKFSAERLFENPKTIKITLFPELLAVISP